MWPNSALKISNAISLNEIINAPSEWQSQAPHYVVQHNDWHQCRFLFVQHDGTSPSNTGVGVKSRPSAKKEKSQELRSPLFEQDPDRQVMGPHNKPLEIPLAAMSTTHHTRQAYSSSASVDDGDVHPYGESDDEEVKDIEFLFSDDEESLEKSVSISRRSSVDTITARQV